MKRDVESNFLGFLKRELILFSTPEVISQLNSTGFPFAGSKINIFKLSLSFTHLKSPDSLKHNSFSSHV